MAEKKDTTKGRSTTTASVGTKRGEAVDFEPQNAEGFSDQAKLDGAAGERQKKLTEEKYEAREEDEPEYITEEEGWAATQKRLEERKIETRHGPAYGEDQPVAPAVQEPDRDPEDK